MAARPERRARSAAQAQEETTGLISRVVHTELERAGGDWDATLKALIKRAIPDVMHLFNETGATACYAYPALPDILKKPSKKARTRSGKHAPASTTPATPCAPPETSRSPPST